MKAHPLEASSFITALKPDEPNKFRIQKLLGEEFVVYFTPNEILNELRFKKLGTSFKLIYVPPLYRGNPIMDVSYIMSGYYPNLTNIKLLSDLMLRQDGVVNICFRYKGLSLHNSEVEHVSKMEKLINCDNVFFNVNCNLDPLTQLQKENSTDLIALPYINTGMFEMDNISFNTLKNFIYKTNVPLMIF